MRGTMRFGAFESEKKEPKTISQHDYLIWSNDFWLLSELLAYWFACRNVEQILHTAFHCKLDWMKRDPIYGAAKSKGHAKKKVRNEYVEQTIEEQKNRLIASLCVKFVVFCCCLLLR